MKPSVIVVAIGAFVAAIAIFSRAYNLLLRFFETPTTLGLVTLFVLVLALAFVLGVLGFIMYATDRRQGGVKVKVHLFERLLGYAPDAPLGAAPQTAPASPRSEPRSGQARKEKK